MKEKRSPFFAFRYLVTPIDNQISITHQLNKTKEELMRDFIQQLNDNTKTEWLKGIKRYLIYGFQNQNDFFVLKYARESDEKYFVEGDDDIEIKGIKGAKFIYLIVDVHHQIILIERNSSVFNSVESSINILTEFFRKRMRKYDYAVNIYPLVSKRSFWTYVDEADEIYELNLTLNAPNFPFLGDSNTRNVLQEIKESTNNEIFEIGLKNKDGRLKIIYSSLGSWINYVREVGGKYAIKFSKNGVQDVKTSYDDTAKTYIVRKKTGKFNEHELNNIETKLSQMHILENRDIDDEENEK